MGNKMRSQEKIKVFISSRCGGEQINYDHLVNTEATDKKTIAEKATKTNYDLVRRGLRVALENTGVIETYLFEDDTASTSSSQEDYLYELDQSDVCLFLIDNFDKEIPEGVLREVERAKQNNKKSIFLFLKDRYHEETGIQKNFTGPEGAHFHEVDDIREFIDEGYKAIRDDIIEIYQKYCKGYLRENKKETSPIETTDKKFEILEEELFSVEVKAESFPTDTTDIDWFILPMKKKFKHQSWTTCA